MFRQRLLFFVGFFYEESAYITAMIADITSTELFV